YGNAPTLKHSDAVISVAFSPNGRQIASGCMDGSVQIWDAWTGRVLHPLQKGGAVRLTYSSDGQLLAGFQIDGTIVVWKSTTWEILASFQSGQDGWTSYLAFSPDGRVLASVRQDVRLWDIGPKDEMNALRLVSIPLEHPARFAAVAFSPDGS